MQGIQRQCSNLILLLICVTFFGCAFRSTEYSPRLRAKSMKGFAEKEFTYESAIANPEKGIRTLTGGVEAYLAEHTGIIWDVPGKDIAKVIAAFRADVVVEEDEVDEEGARTTTTVSTYELDASLFSQGDRISQGQCVAVSIDGYFLTASHVVDGESSVLFFDEYNALEDIDTPRLVPYRVVYRNEAIDFAIIKAELSTPFYLSLHEDAPKFGEIVFAGGSLNGGPASGKMIWNIAIDTDETIEVLGASNLVTNIPITGGDSGAPLIDNLCRMHGVMPATGEYKQYPRKMFTEAVRVSPEFVDTIIEKDRTEYPGSGSE